MAIGARDAERARAMAAEHGVERVVAGYEAVLEDPEVDAVYVPLVNSLHLEWTKRALAAGKHVLCEKPLAMNAAEAEEMAAAAGASGRLLMEAFMYRFHPRIRRLREETSGVVHLSARFGFRLTAEGNYRSVAALGGGALFDVGCYGVNIARWFLGEPDQVTAVGNVRDGLDWSVAAALRFPGGATACVWGSFESAEEQELVLVGEETVARVNRPFTSRHDPDDPYRLMVEEFAEAAMSDGPSPLPVEDSIANLRVLDAIRAELS